MEIETVTVPAVTMMLFFLYPAAKQWLKHGPKGSTSDWMGLLIPLALLVGFVVLLVALVR